MNNLFDPKLCRYTQEASDLYKEADEAIKPIFKKWRNMGYSTREISHLLMHTIFDNECELIIIEGVNSRKEGCRDE